MQPDFDSSTENLVVFDERSSSRSARALWECPRNKPAPQRRRYSSKDPAAAPESAEAKPPSSVPNTLGVPDEWVVVVDRTPRLIVVPGTCGNEAVSDSSVRPVTPSAKELSSTLLPERSPILRWSVSCFPPCLLPLKEERLRAMRMALEEARGRRSASYLGRRSAFGANRRAAPNMILVPLSL